MVWIRSSPPSLDLDLDAYLASLDAQPESAFPNAFAILPATFGKSSVEEGIRIAGLNEAVDKQPGPDLHLVAARIRKFGRSMSGVQLIYGNESEVLAAFVLPSQVKLTFGKRQISRMNLGDISGGSVSAQKVKVFWAANDTHQILLVSRLEDESKRIAAASYFLKKPISLNRLFMFGVIFGNQCEEASVNLGDGSISVRVRLLDFAGNDPATATLNETLAPRAKQRVVFESVFPSADEGIIVVETDEPATALFLRGTLNGVTPSLSLF